MTAIEIIARQQQTGRLCLTLRGMFYTAYNGSAQALGRITGYQVKQTAGSTTSAPCCYAGFPASALDRVVGLLEAGGGRIVCREDTYLELEGIGTEFDPRQVESYPVRGKNKRRAEHPVSVEEMVRKQLLSYPLGEHTPIEAMNFLQSLQERLRGCAGESQQRG